MESRGLLAVELARRANPRGSIRSRSGSFRLTSGSVASSCAGNPQPREMIAHDRTRLTGPLWMGHFWPMAHGGWLMARSKLHPLLLATRHSPRAICHSCSTSFVKTDR